MKKILLALIYFNMNSYGFEFLKNSTLLKKEGIKVYTGELHPNKQEIVLDSRVKKSLQSSYQGKLFQIGPQGFIELQGKIDKGTIDECGEKGEGLALKINFQYPPLIFSGVTKNKEVKLRWHAANELQYMMMPKCFEDMVLGEIGQIQYLQIQGKKKSHYLAHYFKSSGSKEKYIEHGVYGTENGKCIKEEVFKKLSDPDGNNKALGNIRHTYGILSIEKKKAKEEWIIFNSPGLEGDGILAIPYQDYLKKDFTRKEWLIYNGC